MGAALMLDAFSWLTKFISSLNLLLTYPIYVSLLLFLHRQRHRAPFNSSFYRLFVALGVVDLTKYSLYLLKKCSYWGWVPPLFLPFNQPNAWAQLLYLAVWGLSFAQYQLNLLLSLNRFLSILFPQLYRHRWTRQWFQWSVWPVAMSSLCIVLPIAWMPVCFRTTQLELGPNETVTKLTGPVFMNLEDLSLYYGITKGFVVLLLVACLTGYPLCFARVRRMNLLDKNQAVEVKMLYALALLLVANLLYTAYFIVWEILTRVHPQFALYAEWSLYLIIDFYDMNSPYGLLLTSKLIRQSIFPFCLFRRENNAILPERMLTSSSAKAHQMIGKGGGSGGNGRIGLIGYYGASTSSSSGGGGALAPGHNGRNGALGRFGSRGSGGSVAGFGLAIGHGKKQKPPFWAGTAPLNPAANKNDNNNSRRLHVVQLQQSSCGPE